VAYDRQYNAKTKKYSQDVQKGMVKERVARNELTDAQKSSLIVQTKLTAAAHSFASEMQTNFIDSVRESVSILTAFYYKLNQNTQELITFERELLNANSVFRVTNDELFSVGDTVVQFGQKFGLEMQNGAEGLYQLASAGLSASESMEVLTETLKLSMAVQGDHNTISKLVTQTLFGFDMEMSQAAEITDKFAFAIQKSLIEYQDLASAVKFALPFFTTTGQSIDQLLGALQILTNRALEAGIAGRGLRQGLAELAESIGDNTARFKEFGVEVTDAQGNMLQLTEIAANFSKVLEEGVINDTELLTTLIEDLNVRGATAFVHLVQASDEFTEAVAATAGAGGELDAMVRIQNESIGAQIQILKNNIGMMFMYRDATYEGTRFLNAFHEAIITTVESFRGLLVVERDGVSELTAFGKAIQTIAVTGIKEFQKVLHDIVPLIERFIQLGKLGIQVFKIYLIPIKLVVKALDMMGPTMTKVLISFHLLNKIVPISTAANYAFQLSQLRGTKVTAKEIELATASTLVTKGRTAALMTAALWQNITSAAVMKSAAGIIGYTAAEGYLNVAQILGIKIKENMLQGKLVQH
jgi:TP901 family phage tail tape measure protein